MDRLKAKRSARRTQSTKIINEATTLLESGCNDRTAFSKVIDKLVASRDELQKINAELEDVIPIDDLEREYESAAHYDDQTLETLTSLRARLEDLNVGSTLWNILSGDIILSTEVQGLVAVKTNLGWTLQGPTMKTSFINGTSEVMICVLRVQAGEVKGSDRSTLESFWSLDAMGIAPNEATHGHADTLSVFQRKLGNIGKRYQVAVPCKEPDIELLQDNYSVALNRLRNLVKRISKPEGLLERYDTAIRQYIVSGHAEVVLDKESIDGPAYYMPHREVIREDSLTTKLHQDVTGGIVQEKPILLID
ncbi:hypothetical protein HPB49_006869 [Dermacentor silvarum]|uniref:Uncharacterized protein n=1 Tax=Dermacentor silvarum TaxID=543639 RepID=A0ACB8DII6_DERSI|nr:hypothetical protein HPB49_006869 [Dermacentor silvarum]